MTHKGNNFQPAGIRKKVIDEKTSSAAYHIPEGFLLRYGPDLEDVDQNFFNDKGYIKTNCIKSLLEKTLNI